MFLKPKINCSFLGVWFISLQWLVLIMLSEATSRVFLHWRCWTHGGSIYLYWDRFQHHLVFASSWASLSWYFRIFLQIQDTHEIQLIIYGKIPLHSVSISQCKRVARKVGSRVVVQVYYFKLKNNIRYDLFLVWQLLSRLNRDEVSSSLRGQHRLLIGWPLEGYWPAVTSVRGHAAALFCAHARSGSPSCCCHVTLWCGDVLCYLLAETDLSIEKQQLTFGHVIVNYCTYDHVEDSSCLRFLWDSVWRKISCSEQTGGIPHPLLELNDPVTAGKEGVQGKQEINPARTLLYLSPISQSSFSGNSPFTQNNINNTISPFHTVQKYK